MTDTPGLPLHVMPKPIGPICNLDCAYCYYLRKQELYPVDETWRMSEATLETFVRQYIEAQPPDVDEIVFGWQGGEPTLMGVDFFERAVALQKQYTPQGKRCVNSLQTNGTLIDDTWSAFFKENEFLVGVSIDGPANLHDRYRKDKQGRPTHKKVLAGLRLLRDTGVTFNALTVVNRHNGHEGRAVYRFLTDEGVDFIQFIPIVEPVGSALVSERSVEPTQYGQFLIDVFEEWVRNDVGRVFVQIFDEILSAWLGMEPGLCIFRKQCGRAMALEHNGDLYSCDHFVEPACKLGNIHETPIAELAASAQQIRFGQDKEDRLPVYCRECPARFVCNGGCPKNRLITTPDGEPGLNYLCTGYRLFFQTVDPYLTAMADELRHERPAANVMYQLRAREQADRGSTQVGPITPATAGRNDPCPCGSGRKFKHCCLRNQKR